MAQRPEGSGSSRTVGDKNGGESRVNLHSPPGVYKPALAHYVYFKRPFDGSVITGKTLLLTMGQGISQAARHFQPMIERKIRVVLLQTPNRVKLCAFDGGIAPVTAAVTAAARADTGGLATIGTTVLIDRHQSLVGVALGLHGSSNLIFHQVGFLTLVVS